MRRVILVTGAPCSGKTTYVQTHTRLGHTVLDQDILGAKAMAEALSQLHRVGGTIWIIRCAPGPQARAALAQQLHATDHIHLDPPRAELVARAKRRPDPRQAITAIDKWLTAERADTPPPQPRPATPQAHRSIRKGRPYRRAKTNLQANTQMCWLCGHTGAYELDHEPALIVLLELGLDPNDPQYHRAAHGTSCPCPTCGQRCNQVKGAGHRRPRLISEW